MQLSGYSSGKREKPVSTGWERNLFPLWHLLLSRWVHCFVEVVFECCDFWESFFFGMGEISDILNLGIYFLLKLGGIFGVYSLLKRSFGVLECFLFGRWESWGLFSIEMEKGGLGLFSVCGRIGRS